MPFEQHNLVMAAVGVVAGVMLAGGAYLAWPKLKPRVITAILDRHLPWKSLEPDVRSAIEALVRDEDLLPLNALLARSVEPQLRAERFRRMRGPLPIGALERWTAAHPRDAVAWTLLADRYIDKAWEARGGALASEVTEREWRGFGRWLEKAFQATNQAIAADPTDPEVRLLRLTVARGGGEQFPIDVKADFEAAIKGDPQHLGVHLARARMLSERWGGSHAEMRRFALTTSAASGPGSALHSLIALTHIDCFVHHLTIDNNKAAAIAHSADGAVAAEVIQAWEAFLQAPDRDALPATNTFAMWFWITSDAARLAESLAKVGDRYTESPWNEMDGDPTRAFNAAREEARLGAVSHGPI